MLEKLVIYFWYNNEYFNKIAPPEIFTNNFIFKDEYTKFSTSDPNSETTAERCLIPFKENLMVDTDSNQYDVESESYIKNCYTYADLSSTQDSYRCIAMLGVKSGKYNILAKGILKYTNGSEIVVSSGSSISLLPENQLEGSTFTVSPALPAGLTLDPNTGEISGTPTEVIESTNFTVTQTKPDGLTLDPNTGEITGTPTESVSTTNYTVTQTKVDGTTIDSNFTLTITNQPYKNGSTIATSIGSSISLSPEGHISGSTYSITPSLPSGLVFDPNTGVITGTPTEAIDATNFTVTQLKPDGTSVDLTFNLTIANEAYKSGSNIVVNTNSSVLLSPENHVSGSTYSVSPSLPTGLILDPNTGVITGTPTEPLSTTNFTVTQTRPDGGSTTIDLTFDMTINLPTYTVGGSVSSLVSGILVIQNNGGDDLTITSDGGFRFPTAISKGSPYSVTIKTQPNGEIICAVSNGSGNINTDIVNVDITCKYPVATPIITSPEPGHYDSPQHVTITTTTSGASIYFTKDGTTPTTSSILYTEPIHIWALAGEEVTIKAIATKSGFFNSDIASLTTRFTYPPLKTGQTTSYAAGDDASMNKGIARSYTNNGNGTITDNATGLVWDENLAFIRTSLTDAINHCNALNLAGRKWRLPNINELSSLLDISKSSPPTINNTTFPNTAFSFYWSSTTRSQSSDKAWFIHFGDGNMDTYRYDSQSSKSYSNRVRCVAGP